MFILPNPNKILEIKSKELSEYFLYVKVMNEKTLIEIDFDLRYKAEIKSIHKETIELRLDQEDINKLNEVIDFFACEVETAYLNNPSIRGHTVHFFRDLLLYIISVKLSKRLHRILYSVICKRNYTIDIIPRIVILKRIHKNKDIFDEALEEMERSSKQGICLRSKSLVQIV